MKLPSTIVTLGDMKFEIEQLNVERSRELLEIVKHILPQYAEPGEEMEGLSIWGMAYMAGAITKPQYDSVIDIIARSTTVTFSDGRVLNLGDQRDGEAHRNTVFSGQLEVMEEWVDAVIVFNFKSMMGKLKAVAERAKARAAARKSKAGSPLPSRGASTGSSGRS